MAWSAMLWRCFAKKRTLVLVAVLVTLVLLFHFRDHTDQVQTYFRELLENENDNSPIASLGRDLYSLGTYVLDDTQPNTLSNRTHPTPVPYNPYPDHKDDDSHRSCVGPRGNFLSRTNPVDMMLGYRWDVSSDQPGTGFPSPVFGSYEAVSFDRSICTDRYSRYGAYGYGEREERDVPGFKKRSPVAWDSIDWGALQHECLQRNAHRYDRLNHQRPWSLHREHEDLISPPSDQSGSRKRTAVVLRSWKGMKYTENDLQNIRSLIMELSLFSGAEYEVFLLIDMQSKNLPSLDDETAVQKLKDSMLPKELHGLAVFFNYEMLQAWYPKVDEHRATLQYFQSLQVFAHLHPEFDFFWQFEMDARYTGHTYHLLEQATSFARKQPRKFLWERNSYFYMPPVHGHWKEFLQRVDRDMQGRESIWGPRSAQNITPSDDSPVPPAADPVDDHYKWGVGEEADMITWLPTFNPVDFDWPYRDKVYNFGKDNAPPRRATVVAMSRTSSRLLRAMHRDQAEKGLALASEMSAVSWALFYGLKVVQIPQPVYLEGHDWEGGDNLTALERRANAGDSPNRINAGEDSFWNWAFNDDKFHHLTYLFQSPLPGKIYRAWLGHKTKDGKGGKKWEKKYGRLCLPPMFLHPVKHEHVS